MTLIRTAVDTWDDQAAPTVNKGDSARLSLNGGAGTNNRRAFILFAVPAGLRGSSVLSAKLRVFAKGAFASGATITVKRITSKWAESRLTWNTGQPAVVTTNQVAVAPGAIADGAMIEFNVVTMMQDVAGGGAFYGFRLELDIDSTRTLHSAEAILASLRPQLDLVWSIAPDAPTSLAPAGGRAVSLSKPILAWVFRDPDTGSSQTSSQVQISTSSDFTTPEYDSGKVANTQHLWDLAPTAYAGVPADATRFWRVRVWDDADIVSAYSDPVSFQRKAKGSVALTSPGVGGTVDDLSPPIAWTFTPPAGASQEGFRVLLYRLPAGGGLELLHDTGRITSTATSYGIPEGLIVSGQNYRVEVRIFDTVDRQAIAGDPDYVSATRDFVYARSGAPAAVTSLTAVATPSGGPGVQLDFQRATMPDYFTLKVDGVEVVPRIVASDAFVSGTSYRFTYWGATPRASHTYEVEAVVASGGVLQNSDGNATAVLATDPTSIWLVDPEDNLTAKIDGQQGLGGGIGASGTVHNLRGRRAPVRIIDTIRGYEGEVSGLLRGKTQRDNYLTLYGRITTLRLIVSDWNFPVTIGGVSAPATPLRGDRLYGCSFDFTQVGDFTFDVAGS